MKNKVVRAVLAVVMACSLFASCQPVVTFANNAEQMISAEEKETTKPLKIVGVIPARYASSRFPGKPLADICGKPMVWWVYQQAKKVPELSEVYVATDDERIEAVCKQYNMNVIMTSKDVKTCTGRICAASKQISADIYIAINGDEPLIDPAVISKIIPTEIDKRECFIANIVSEVNDPVEAIDFTNIKVVSDAQDNILFMSRSPIPYPKASMDYKYLKHIGIMAYNLEALNLYENTAKGFLESIEDVDYLRFIENGKRVKAIRAKSKSLSVDTQKDLERVRSIISENLKKN